MTTGESQPGIPEEPLVPDGTQLDVSRPEPDGPWRLDREDDRLPSDSGGSRIVSGDPTEPP